LRDALNEALPSLATVPSKFTLGLPQCIAMNDVRFEALSPCVDYNNTKIGFVSRDSGPPPVTYSVDFSKTKVIATSGEIELDFEQ